MGDTQETKYHEVKLPLIDIYQDGEQQAFRVLSRKVDGEKNLIIFPSEFRKTLVPENGHGNSRVMSVPGTIALEYLSKFPITFSDEFYAIFEANEGLDIAYMKKPGFSSPDNLTKRVTDLFSKPPTIVTTCEDEITHYRALGFNAEKPRDFILAEADIVNRGRIQGSDDLCARLYESEVHSIDLEDAKELLKKPGDQDPPNIFYNQFIEFTGNGTGGAAVAMVLPGPDRVELLDIPENFMYRINNHHFSSTTGIKARWLEQYLAVQKALIDPRINHVFLCGTHGCGKTILAYSAGLDQIAIYPEEIQRKRGLPAGKERRGAFRQIAIFRPNDPIGGKKRAIGTLPGEQWDKTEQQYGSFISAHEALQRARSANFAFEELLRHPDRANKIGDKRTHGLRIGDGVLPPDCEAIKLYSFADIQGCNFEDLYVIIDEAENFTQKELRALFSRGCKSSKYVILGDPLQVVNTECTKDKNGLTSAVRHYLPFDDVVLFNLTKNNRGPISRRAESWLT